MAKELYRVEKLSNIIIEEFEDLVDALRFQRENYPSKVVRDSDDVLLSIHLNRRSKQRVVCRFTEQFRGAA